MASLNPINPYGFIQNGKYCPLSSEEINVSKKIVAVFVQILVFKWSASAWSLKTGVGLIGVSALTTFYLTTTFFKWLHIKNFTALPNHITDHFLNSPVILKKDGKFRLTPAEISLADIAAVVAMGIVTLGFGVKQTLIVAIGAMHLSLLITFFAVTAYFKWRLLSPSAPSTDLPNWLQPQLSDNGDQRLQRAYFASLHKAVILKKNVYWHWWNYSDRDAEVKKGTIEIIITEINETTQKNRFAELAERAQFLL